MVRYTPEERAERRRRSSDRKKTTEPLIQDDEASWIADLRGQGVDVDEFLKVGSPSEFVVEVPNDERNDERNGDGSRPSQPRRQSRLSILSLTPDSDMPTDLTSSSSANGGGGGRTKRFTQFLDKAYVFDESVGDFVFNSVEDMSRRRWEEEVREDSKNYVPESTTPERTEQNKKWALEMARRRVAEEEGAGRGTTAIDGQRNDDDDDDDDDGGDNDDDGPSDDGNVVIYPKVDPPPTTPLPQIDERDFELSEPALNPAELGIAPPPLPHPPSDLVPRTARAAASRGIGDGVFVDGGYEEATSSCDADTMAIRCSNADCAVYLICSRASSLVRCANCRTVGPACPALGGEGERDSMTAVVNGATVRGASFS